MSIISYLANRYRHITEDVDKLLSTNLQYNQQVTMIKTAINNERKILRSCSKVFSDYKFAEFGNFKQKISIRVDLIESTPMGQADKKKLREIKKEIQKILMEISCFKNKMHFQTVQFENLKNASYGKIQELRNLVEEFSQKISINCDEAEKLGTMATHIYEMAVAIDSNAENLFRQYINH